MAIETFVWLDPSQTDLVRRVASLAGLSIIAAGSNERGRSAQVAAALSCESVDDIRNALATTTAAVVLLASPGALGAAGHGAASDDESVMEELRSRGATIVSLEPIPASVLQLAAPDAGASLELTLPAGEDWAPMAPLMRASRSWRAAAEVLEQFGPARSASVRMLAGQGEGSLGARLFDAADLLGSLAGQPDAVHASYIWPARAGALRPSPGDSLRGLTGDLCATLSWSDGRAASVFLSDHAGGWDRSVTLLGENGRVTIDDAGLVWTRPDGAVVDSSRRDAELEPPANAAAVLIAREVNRLLDPSTKGGAGTAPTDAARTLAIAGAALLSARTGEVESPATILRMAGSA